ncbi:MAG: DoxX family membrane protein [Candidatus Caenarcaniphilales bacterium]|nr:DoxX family membrane protein [Candidatus Caenarcaniphilales bacterium]
MEIQTPKPWLFSLIRYFLGSVFIVSGFSKLLPLKDFVQQALAYKIPIPEDALYYLSVFLIAIEVWVGLSILLNCNLRVSLLGAQILLIGMIPITIWGSLNQAPTCGCYGNLIKREPWQATVEDCLLLAVSFMLLPCSKSKCKTSAFATIKSIVTLLITIGALVYGIIQIQNIIPSPIDKLI